MQIPKCKFPWNSQELDWILRNLKKQIPKKIEILIFLGICTKTLMSPSYCPTIACLVHEKNDKVISWLEKTRSLIQSSFFGTYNIYCFEFVLYLLCSGGDMYPVA